MFQYVSTSLKRILEWIGISALNFQWNHKDEAYLSDGFNGVIIQVSDFDELEGYLNFLKDWITKKPSPISWEFIECP